MKRTLHTMAATAVAASLALLAACGGGGGSGATTDAATSATAAPAAAPASSAATASVVQGTITGFGSVIIDGTRYDDSAAKVAFNLDPNSATPGTLADLKIGQRIDARLQDGKLADVTVSFAIKGPLDSVDVANATLLVFGQKIRVLLTGATPTALEGFSALADLVAGDLLQVAGVANADKTVTATRLERRPAEAQVNLRLTGVAAELDATAKTFTFGLEHKVKVNYATARVLPAGATIANGATLAVYAERVLDKTSAVPVLTAKTVEVQDRKLQEGSDVGLGGPVGDFQSLARFKIGETVVNASTATLVDGTSAADVVNGARAYVKGSIANGMLVASQLKVSKPETEDKPRLIGPVTEFVSLSQFKLRGVQVDASNASFVGGVAADVANGTWMDVTGRLEKDTVKAELVKVTPPPAAVLQTMAGAVHDFNAQSRSFKLLGVAMRLTDTTAYAPAGQTLANLANDKLVVVKGSYSESARVFTVTALEIKEPAEPVRRVEIGGVISALVQGGFKFGDATITLGAGVSFVPAGTTASSLKAGMKVKLVGLVDPASKAITAQTVEVVSAAQTEPMPVSSSGTAAAVLRLVHFEGAVTDFVSLSNFRVAGQKVDATAPGLVFDGCTAADIVNGAALELEATVTAGSNVATARKVHLRK